MDIAIVNLFLQNIEMMNFFEDEIFPIEEVKDLFVFVAFLPVSFEISVEVDGKVEYKFLTVFEEDLFRTIIESSIDVEEDVFRLISDISLLEVGLIVDNYFIVQLLV